MTTLPTTIERGSPGLPEVAEARELIRELVLLTEGLSTDEQFRALTGIDLLDVPQLLADPIRITQLERMKREMETSGELTRLDAAKRSRKVIGLADQIMGDEEAHPSTRLNAGQTILRAAGTEKPAVDATKAEERFSVVINLGDPSKDVRIDAKPIRRAIAASSEAE